MEEFSYVEWRSKENIRPLELPSKEDFYSDLIVIEHSVTGRLDVSGYGNEFILESVQLIINALELFERGYFDCAYYSLRSALEFSMTLVYLTDMPHEKRKRIIEKWQTGKSFPMRVEIAKQLSTNGNVYVDMLAKMPGFFAEAKVLNKKINKYVHKQGLDNFYVIKNHPRNRKNSYDAFINEFEEDVHSIIRIFAVMRLAIDPFPILLNDSEILYRCYDSLTEPYPDEFIEKYFGEKLINQYKQTDSYQTVYDSFMNEEKKTESVFDVMKYGYIDTSKYSEIKEQFHLLSKNDVVAVEIAISNPKIAKIHTHHGMWSYATDREQKRKTMSYYSGNFVEFENAKNPYNQKYDNVFISVLVYDGSIFFVEHNELLNNEEIESLNALIVDNKGQ